MPVSWASKDASEVRNYRYSWLGRLNGAEIDSATLTVESGTVTLSNVSNTINSISATVTGGDDCEDAVLLSTIVTDNGETLEQSILLSVRPSYLLNAGPSTSTKRQIVEMAYEECSLAGYEFDVTPEEQFSALRQLDALMAQWAMESMNLGYNAPAIFGEGDLEDYSGIPDAAITGVSITLGMAKAPAMGKTLSPETRARLSKAMLVIRTMCAQTRQMGWARGTPAGAGNRYVYPSPFMIAGRQCP